METNGRLRYLEALLGEVRILARSIAGNADQSLSAVEITLGGGSTALPLKYHDVVQWFIEAEDTIEQGITDNKIVIDLTAKLQLARDALISQTKPANGLSIAYSSLVAGIERGKGVQSSFSLASKAFPGLRLTSWFHRKFILSLSLIAIILTFFASWEATKASLGKSLLQTLDPLRAQQFSISNEKVKLEARLEFELQKQKETDRKSSAPMEVQNATHNTVMKINSEISEHLSYLPVCDRHLLTGRIPIPDEHAQKKYTKIRLHFSSDIRDICERDSVLAKNIQRAQLQLQQFVKYWPDMIGGPYLSTARTYDFVSNGFLKWMNMDLSNGTDSGRKGERFLLDCQEENKINCGSTDVELRVAPIVSVISNFILPVTLGIVGSLLYVILDHYTKLRKLLLMPQDFPLSALRVILGIVVAICISLLIVGGATPNAPMPLAANGSVPPGSLVGSLALSASLITFLAGFGAEAVFSMLHDLVLRIFPPSNKT